MCRVAAFGMGMRLGLRRTSHLLRSEGEEVLGHVHQGRDGGAVVALRGVVVGGSRGSHLRRYVEQRVPLSGICRSMIRCCSQTWDIKIISKIESSYVHVPRPFPLHLSYYSRGLNQDVSSLQWQDKHSGDRS